MRFRRTLALLGVLLLWLLLGPWVLVAALAPLAVPRVRAWLRPTRRVSLGIVLALTAVTGLVALVPDGRLPIPPGAGGLVTPAYVGRPALAQPLGHAARPSASPGADPTARAGPLGESPTVDTAWFGLEECTSLAVERHGRLVALCTDRSGPLLHVVDPESLHPLVTKELPDDADGAGVLCGRAGSYLDELDRVVVATTDRRVLVVDTADAEEAADLTTVASYDLAAHVPADDCPVALAPDRTGRIWFATERGRVGALDPATGRVAVVALGEEVANPLAVDRDGVYVVTTGALYRFRAGGRPVVAWRTAYDRGDGTKKGQLSHGSGSAPALLPGGLVAITDNAEPRMRVVVLRRDSGGAVCEQAVFGEDEGATESTLVAVGDGVVVTNNHGYGGPVSTVLGRITEPGVARVDVGGGRCTVAWTTGTVVPSAAPVLSRPTGLLYAVTKRRSWWGAGAWYLSALDVRTGRSVFSVRTGLGSQFNSHRAAPTLGPDGSAYVATLTGMVRVRDRAPR